VEGAPVRVVTYNILADDYAAFQPVAPQLLAWERRRGVMGAELERIAGDVVCIEECDRYEEVATMLGKQGLVGRFAVRPHHRRDGCALFVRQRRFAIGRTLVVQFDEVAQTQAGKRVLGTKMPELVGQLRTGNVALIAEVIEKRASYDSRMVVAVAHLYWDPLVPHVKLLQAVYLVQHIAWAMQHWGGIRRCIIGGDLNSRPDSAVYRWLSQGKLTADDIAQLRREIDTEMGKEFGSMVVVEDFAAEHTLHLRSAYAALGEPPTNFTKAFTGCIDFIFYTHQTLMPTHVLSPQPLLREDGTAVVLPDSHHASDHVPLAATFVRLRQPPDHQQQQQKQQ